MTELASADQLRSSFLRWALVLVPGVLVLGFFSGQLAGSGPGNPWFDALQKPSIYPPASVFGPVWTVLYALMGLAIAIVVGARGAAWRGKAIGLFVVQLVLNLAWSPLFFAAHQITGSLILLVALDLVVIATIAVFWRVRPVAGLLLLPYLAWIMFATYLTFEFRQANPQADGQQVTGAATRIQI